MKNLKDLSKENSVSIVRENYLGDLDVSYFNIDNLTEKQEIFESGIYQRAQNLKTELEKLKHTVHLQNYEIPITSEQEMFEAETWGSQAEVKTRMTIQAAEKIRTLIHGENLNSMSINNLIKYDTSNIYEKSFVKRFQELYQYVPTEQLLEILISKSNSTRRVHKRIYMMLIFWALAENHPFKITIRQYFDVNESYTKDEILNFFKPLIITFFGITILNAKEAVSYLDLICEKFPTKVTRNQIKTDGYGIRNLLPLDINVVRNFEPKQIIPHNETDLNRKFKYI